MLNKSKRAALRSMRAVSITILCSLFLAENLNNIDSLLATVSTEPTIQIQPESLFFGTTESYDTLLVVNTGNVDLVIDSVKSSKPFGYGFEVVTKDTTFYWFVFGSRDIEQFERDKLSLAPQDSALLITFSPDLCPVCSSISVEFFTDTLFVFSNDSLNSPVKILASGEGRPSGVLAEPTIQIQPESLFFETVESYDTLLVVNTGNVDLVIDSVKSSKPFGYSFEVVTKDTTFYWFVFGSHDIEQFERDKLSLAPQDSALLITFSPDLCPICSSISVEFFTDTLFVFSNGSLNNPVEILASGEGHPSAVEQANSNIPKAFVLYPNYPNPFNPTTNIRFSLPTEAELSIVIYNSLGQRVKSLAHHTQFPAGEHQIVWDGQNEKTGRVASGTYFLKMFTMQGRKNVPFTQTIQMTLLQ